MNLAPNNNINVLEFKASPCQSFPTPPLGNKQLILVTIVSCFYSIIKYLNITPYGNSFYNYVHNKQVPGTSKKINNVENVFVTLQANIVRTPDTTPSPFPDLNDSGKSDRATSPCPPYPFLLAEILMPSFESYHKIAVYVHRIRLTSMP